MENDNSWIVCPLKDKNVNEVVIPEHFVSDLRNVSKSNEETAGLLYGFLRDEQVYLLGLLGLGTGDKNSVRFNEKYRNFQNEFVKRVSSIKPNLVSVLYHNHPRQNIKKYPEETLEILNRELKEGVFDYLKDMGIKPNIKNAIEEQTRQLSIEDIDSTFGNAHILLTDTERKGNNLDHVNAYKFIPSAWKGVDKFKISVLDKKSIQKPFISTWVVSYCNT